MPKTIHAIYENGVFRPVEPVELPEHTPVEFEPRVVAQPSEAAEGMAKIYAILGERYQSGQSDTAERHNEHQP